MIDFESEDPDLPSWGAVASGADGQVRGTRLASRWTEPFTVHVDGEAARSGSSSLRWEFVEDTASSAVSVQIPVSGSTVTISFFVRTAGVLGEGLVSVTQFDPDSGGERQKNQWGVAKIPESEDWMEVNWTGPLEPGAAMIRLSFNYPQPVSAGAKVWIDDIKVTSE